VLWKKKKKKKKSYFDSLILKDKKNQLYDLDVS
jgi:hypothetical protein